MATTTTTGTCAVKLTMQQEANLEVSWFRIGIMSTFEKCRTCAGRNICQSAVVPAWTQPRGSLAPPARDAVSVRTATVQASSNR